MRQTKQVKRTFKRQRQFARIMAMEQRQIAYYYNGIIKAEETDLDLAAIR
jgi:hypothetical protein